MEYRVYISTVKNNLEKEIINGLKWINWSEIVNQSSVVFIKPNFMNSRPKPGVTTSIELLDILLQIMKKRAGRVILGESDAFNFKAEEAFKQHRMYEVCEKNDVELVNLCNLPSTFCETIINSKKIRIELPKILLEEVDVLIDVPVLKTHVVTGVSLGMKNLWGCIPDYKRLMYHPILDHGLVAIAKLLKPRISIIDGSYALDGRGPVFGNPVKMNSLIVSNNVVASDIMGCELMNIQYSGIRHITLAQKEEIGPKNKKEIILKTNNYIQSTRKFKVERTLFDAVAIVTYKSHLLTKITYDSILTPIIYRVLAQFREKDGGDGECGY